MVALQRGWVILGNQEQDSHRVEVRVWRLPLGQLDGCDAQGPDVSLDRMAHRTVDTCNILSYM